MPSGKQVRAGKAAVELGIRDRLDKGLKAARAKLLAFGKGLAAVGAAGAAMATVLVGAGFTAAKKFAEVGDQLDKMRARTGISAKALSGLGFAAEQGGASIEQLDKSLAAMARFSLMVERDLATATDALDMLGISSDQFKAVSPEQRFKLLADAISKVSDPTLRAGLALQVFGRSGRELLPMLQGGAAGIEELMAEAERLGITLSDDDATAAAKLTDQMNILRRQLQGVVVQIGSALAPMLIELFQRIQPVIARVVDWIKTNKELVTNSEVMWLQLQILWTRGVGIIGAAWEGLKGRILDAWDIVTTTIRSVWTQVSGWLAAKMVELAGVMLRPFEQLFELMERIPGAVGRLAADMKTIVQIPDQVAAQIEQDTAAQVDQLQSGLNERIMAREAERERQLENMREGLASMQAELEEKLRAAKEAQADAVQQQAEQIALNLPETPAAGKGLTGTFSAAQAAAFRAVSTPLEQRMADGIDRLVTNTNGLIPAIENATPEFQP